MTDSYLMEANCIHGTVWYDCVICEKEMFNNNLIAEQPNKTASIHDASD